MRKYKVYYIDYTLGIIIDDVVELAVGLLISHETTKPSSNYK